MHGDKHYKHEETKKYYPKGALFWFECDEYGEPLGTAVFIENVPRKHKGPTDSGLRRLKAARQYIQPLKTALAREPTCMEHSDSCVKPKLIQGR